MNRNPFTQSSNETKRVLRKLEDKNHCLHLLENTTNQLLEVSTSSFTLFAEKSSIPIENVLINILFINVNAVKMWNMQKTLNP